MERERERSERYEQKKNASLFYNKKTQCSAQFDAAAAAARAASPAEQKNRWQCRWKKQRRL